MLTVVLFAMTVPIVAVTAFLALRSRFAGLAANSRGIALQTIIVMVVLLAIAGAVVAILATRAGDEQDRLEDQTINYSQWNNNKTGCELAGGNYSGTTCSGS